MLATVDLPTLAWALGTVFLGVFLPAILAKGSE